MGQVSIAHRDLYLFNGAYQQPVSVSINQIFECRQPVPTLVLYLEEDFEYCDVLHLMYGHRPNIMTLWDWHDQFWERLHDRTGQTLDSLFWDVASCRYDLPHLAEKSYLIHEIQKAEMERRIRRRMPQPTFRPPKEFF